jgi:hypothetical protein
MADPRLEQIAADATSRGRRMGRIHVPGPVAAETIGKRFGDWEVLSWIPPVERNEPNRNLRARCGCCGTEHEVALSNLRRGQSSRCKPCALRAIRLSNPHSTAAMVVASSIKLLPQMNAEQLDQLLQAVLAERDGRAI